jgi:hypothetical protein
MIDGGEFLLLATLARGHRRSSTLRYKRLHQDGSLESPLNWRRRGNTGKTVNLSGKRTEYMQMQRYFFCIVQYLYIQGSNHMDLTSFNF